MLTETSIPWKNEWRFAAAAHRLRNRFATAHIPKSVSKLRKKLCRNRKNNLCHSERSRGISRMRFRIAFVIALSLFIAAAHAEKVSLVGATVINPADGKVLPN